MRPLRNLPIQRKLAALMMATSACALLLASVGFMGYDLFRLTTLMPRELDLKAQLIANNARAPLEYEDEDFARDKLLAPLKSERSLLQAVLYDVKDRVFAEYLRADAVSLKPPPPPSGGGYRFTAKGVEVFRRVLNDEGKVVGTLCLISDYQEVYGRAFRYAQIALLVLLIALLAAALLSSRLQRLVSDPLLHLAETARVVAERKDYSLRARISSQDEIGLLTQGFNQMLEVIQAQETALEADHARELAIQVRELQEQIEERRKAEQEREVLSRQLQDASRQAGMAEVATGVLHNVGNVLNSVNVSASLVAERVRSSRVAKLPRLAALLEENRDRLGDFLTQDPRGREVPAYLKQVAAHLEQERAENETELRSLAKNIEHIKEIVAVQQSYARVSGVTQMLPITGLLEDALSMVAVGLERHGVQVVREYQEVPTVSVDKHKTLQILLNLLRNAKHALTAVATPQRTLHLRVRRSGTDRLQVQVQDNGVGIAKENLTRIFSHGFTTKRDGHGFGLHVGALAAREMGGQLLAASDGPGRGATFTLELPLQAAAASDAVDPDTREAISAPSAA